MPDRNEFGIDYKNAIGNVELNFTTVPNVTIAANYTAFLSATEASGTVIHYKVVKDGWYVISATTLLWDNSKGDVHGDRMATIMSASLWADMTGTPFIDPPGSQPEETQNSSGVSEATSPGPSSGFLPLVCAFLPQSHGERRQSGQSAELHRFHGRARYDDNRGILLQTLRQQSRCVASQGNEHAL
jgi:hypothetical protein